MLQTLFPSPVTRRYGKNVLSVLTLYARTFCFDLNLDVETSLRGPVVKNTSVAPMRTVRFN